MTAVRKVVWTQKAKHDYTRIINYLLKEWSLKEVNKFNEKTIKAIQHISEFPELFSLSRKKNIRKYLLGKQTTLYYKIFPDKIILITFWDNRRNPSKLKL